MDRRRVLVIEDEESISGPLVEALNREGFNTEVAATAADGLEAAYERRPDVVLLDLMLPDGDGRDVCRELRRRSDVPIIMLTARGLETDRVVGLELGADDYVVKPFSLMELVARIRAVLRRARPRPTAAPDGLSVGDVSIDLATWSATKGGRALPLTRREFELLRELMQNAGRVLEREYLMEEVWDSNWFGSTKTLDVHISTLRRKLDDDPTDPTYIHTVRGVGFRFVSAEELGA